MRLRFCIRVWQWKLWFVAFLVVLSLRNRRPPPPRWHCGEVLLDIDHDNDHDKAHFDKELSHIEIPLEIQPNRL